MKWKAGNWKACYWNAEPRLQNERIFRLPRQLEYNDDIEICGKISPNPEKLFLNLKAAAGFPGYLKITCQIEVDFSLQKIIFRIIENGKDKTHVSDKSPSDIFPDSEFKFVIQVRDEGSPKLYLYIGQSYVDSWDEIQNLKNIKYLTLSNDIEKVEELKFRYP